MKRKLALLLALVMVISMLPMTAFAASNNSIDRVPQVSDDYTGFDTVANAPKLRIEERNNGEFGTSPQTFRLNLTNAEWIAGSEAAFEAVVSTNVTSTVYAKQLTDTSMEITIQKHAPYATAKGVWQMPLLSEVTSQGDVQVTLDARDSALTSGTYTYAVAAGGKTVTTVESVRTIGQAGTLASIEIDETRINALGTGGKKVELRLPNDFKWDGVTAGMISFGGGLSGATVGTISGNGDRDLTINLTLPTGRTQRGSIIINGAPIKADSRARFGDVDVIVRGDATQETIRVARYVDYDVIVEADGAPRTVVAGRYDATSTDGVFRLQDLVIKEEIKGAWLDSRVTRVEFPSWVKVMAADVRTSSSNLAATGTGVITVNQEENYVEFSNVKNAAGDKAKMVVRFFVSVEANRTGEIVATVSGRSLAETTEVVLGNAVAPVEVEANAENVRIGLQNQKIGEITITETAKERILSNEDIVVDLKDFNWKEVPKVEVTEGDLRIETPTIDGSVLRFRVRNDSSEPSTIKITEGRVDIGRFLPEGQFYAEIGGEALVQNNVALSGVTLETGGFRRDYVARVLVANVITPAPGQEAITEEVRFTIGSTNYMVGNELEAMGVAPYIKDNRTFVPVAFVARALGMDRSAVVWNHTNRTVTIFGERVVQMEIGSNVMMINGVSVTMDTAPEITMDRTFVPIAHAARALGVEYSWDQATQTVTFH